MQAISRSPESDAISDPVNWPKDLNSVAETNPRRVAKRRSLGSQTLPRLLVRAHSRLCFHFQVVSTGRASALGPSGPWLP